MPKASQRILRDRFNRILTSGSVGGIIALGGAALILVVVGALVATSFRIHAGEENLSFVDAAWEILQRAIDPGQLDGELRWDSRILLLFVTAVGILLISTLISIVNSTLERRIENLRRGRAPVKASNHIVILGWNALGTKVTEQLARAYFDSGEFELVIVSNADPLEITREIQDDLLRRSFFQSRKKFITRPENWLTIRRGSITNIQDLSALARLEDARSVLILGDQPTDAEITKVVLAIVATIQGESVTRVSALPVVASFEDTSLARRLTARVNALSIESALDGEPIAEILPVTPQFIRTGIESKVARHRGLSDVYRDILDFDGDEFYTVKPPIGINTYGEVVDCEGVVVLGIVRDSEIDLWPNWDTPLNGADLIVFGPSRTDIQRLLLQSDNLRLIGARPIGRALNNVSETVLIVGWNDNARRLTKSLKDTSAAGSSITVLNYDIDEVAESLKLTDVQVELKRRSNDEDPLDSADFIDRFDHVVILAREELSADESDALVLADVLACRVVVRERESLREQPATVVAELRQRTSKNIAGVRLADDLLLSDSLTASAMAQLAVNPQLLPILSAIMESDSPESPQFVSLSSASDAFIGVEWREVGRLLYQSTGELAVAIRHGGRMATVKVNPQSSTRISEGDEVVVFSKYA